MNIPVVSIGMPVFNDEVFLERALKSLLSQSFTDFELIISDDGSSDGSEEICKAYAANDNRIKYIRQPLNMGISANMKFLLEKASGEYFMWAANDDMWDKDFILLLLDALQQDKERIASFGPVVFIDEDDRPIDKHPIRTTDYSGSNSRIRINKLIKIFDDSFGYGLFRRERILGVQFPKWWWINSKCAYNNIYPTLCYYLAKGDFKLVESKPLWFNRLKADENINHKVPFPKSLIRGWLAYSLRRFNLVVFSLYQVFRARHDIILVISIMPNMLYRWWLKSSILDLLHKINLYKAKRINLF